MLAELRLQCCTWLAAAQAGGLSHVCMLAWPAQTLVLSLLHLERSRDNFVLLPCRDDEQSVRIDVDAAEEPERAGPPPTGGQVAAAAARAGSAAADLEEGPPSADQPTAEVQGPADAGALDADEAQLDGRAGEHAHLNGSAEPAPPEPDEKRAAAAAVAHGLPKLSDSLVRCYVRPCAPRVPLPAAPLLLAPQLHVGQVKQLAEYSGLADTALALQHLRTLCSLLMI